MTPGADADSPLPGIGLIGCGGISESHLGAYKRLGLPVRALCNRTLSKAHERAAEFFPEAHVCCDHRELLALPEVEVVDITTHPPERIDLIADALRAGKHVLSQKPFVLDLREGERLIALAEEQGHHPDISFGGGYCNVVLYTHKIKGLHENDFIMAAKIDRLE